MWVSTSILDAAIIKDPGKLDGSPTPGARTTSSRGGGWLPRALGSPAADPCHCATNVCGWLEVYDYEDKAGTPWTTNPLGFPEQ